jgi:hypothetical protein
MMTANRHNKYRVHKETDKLRTVTHWDMDYLSIAVIETLYRQKQSDRPPQRPSISHQGNRGRLPLVLIAAGIALLVLSLTIASRL